MQQMTAHAIAEAALLKYASSNEPLEKEALSLVANAARLLPALGRGLLSGGKFLARGAKGKGFLQGAKGAIGSGWKGFSRGMRPGTLRGYAGKAVGRPQWGSAARAAYQAQPRGFKAGVGNMLSTRNMLGGYGAISLFDDGVEGKNAVEAYQNGTANAFAYARANPLKMIGSNFISDDAFARRLDEQTKFPGSGFLGASVGDRFKEHYNQYKADPGYRPGKLEALGF